MFARGRNSSGHGHDRGARIAQRLARSDFWGALDEKFARGMVAANRGAVRNYEKLGFVFVLLTACSADVPAIDESSDATAGASIDLSDHLSGCHGHASSTIPADGKYVITTFGGGSDTQTMSCGGTADGVGWYAASRQRYGCGAHLQVVATNGNCVVVEAKDYGPDVCVENAAHSPILDMSPRASKALYGISGAGWSDHITVTVTEVDSSTPLGTCTTTTGGGGGGSGSGSGGGGGTTGAACSSATMDRDVDDGECVQAASDSAWYQCQNGSFVAISSRASCTSQYAWCSSATLGKSVPPRTCVQAASDSTWYQCNGQGWVTPVDETTEAGPIGNCASWNAL
jgi:hypothetical protein